jgi:hypothetical protein
MSKTADLRAPISPFTIPDRDFYNLQIKLSGSEEQIEISKRIEISKIFPSSDYFLVIFLPEDFGTSQGISNTLLQQICKCPAEKFVAKEV